MEVALVICAFLTFLIGLLGNITNIYAFTRKQLLKHITFRLLLYLSITDLLVLLVGKPHVIAILISEYDFRQYSNIICAVHSFLILFLSHLSSCLLAATSICRVFTMSKTKSNGNRGRQSKNWIISLPEYVTIGLVFTLMLINSHYLFDMRLNTQNETTRCFPNEEQNKAYFSFLVKIWPWIDLMVYCLIPLVIMIICSIIIIFQLKHLANRRQEKAKHVYRVLLMLNLSFSLFVTPVVILNAFGKFGDHLISGVVHLIAYLNHSLNFIFYFSSCEQYRKTILKLFDKSSNKFPTQTQTRKHSSSVSYNPYTYNKQRFQSSV